MIGVIIAIYTLQTTTNTRKGRVAGLGYVITSILCLYVWIFCAFSLICITFYYLFKDILKPFCFKGRFWTVRLFLDLDLYLLLCFYSFVKRWSFYVSFFAMNYEL